MRPFYTALIQKEDDVFVSFCPELDIASQGDTIEDAKTNLQEAVELFLEEASINEISDRTKGDVYVTSFEVKIA